MKSTKSLIEAALKNNQKVRQVLIEGRHVLEIHTLSQEHLTPAGKLRRSAQAHTLPLPLAKGYELRVEPA